MRGVLSLALALAALLALAACGAVAPSPTTTVPPATAAPTAAGVATAAVGTPSVTRAVVPATPATAATAASAASPVVASRPLLVVAPTAGPVGTTFYTTGEGFPPATLLIGTLTDPTGKRYPAILAHGRRPDNMADINGRFFVADSWLAEAGGPAGVYTVKVALATAPEVPLATATFTVIAP